MLHCPNSNVQSCADRVVIVKNFLFAVKQRGPVTRGVQDENFPAMLEQKVFAKKLKKSKRRSGYKILYLWSDILRCAKIHMKIEREGTSSVAITRPYTEQRVKELEAEIERLKKEPSGGSARSVVAPLE